MEIIFFAYLTELYRGKIKELYGDDFWKGYHQIQTIRLFRKQASHFELFLNRQSDLLKPYFLSTTKKWCLIHVLAQLIASVVTIYQGYHVFCPTIAIHKACQFRSLNSWFQ